MLKHLVPKFRSDLSTCLKDIAEKTGTREGETDSSRERVAALTILGVRSRRAGGAYSPSPSPPMVFGGVKKWWRFYGACQISLLHISCNFGDGHLSSG